jgi:hypothetical protein
MGPQQGTTEQREKAKKSRIGRKTEAEAYTWQTYLPCNYLCYCHARPGLMRGRHSDSWPIVFLNHGRNREFDAIARDLNNLI